MENKTNEELKSELDRIRGLMVNYMGSYSKKPKHEHEAISYSLHCFQFQKNAIEEELKNRESKE